MRKRMLGVKAIVAGSVKSRWIWRDKNRAGLPVLDQKQRNGIHEVGRVYNLLRRLRRDLPGAAIDDHDRGQLEAAGRLLHSAGLYLRGVVNRHVDLTWPDEDEFARGAVELIRQNGAGHDVD